MIILETKQLTKTYENQNEPVLKGIDWSIKEQEFTAVMGRSGCGKTTLLKLLGLLDEPTSGEIYFKGKRIHTLWDAEIADIRRRNIGFIFQDYNLMEGITAGENILLPAILDKADLKKRKEKRKGLMEQFQISGLINKYPYELSGGEKQRVSLCRALINDPDLVLADEPTGNLDSAMGEEVINLLESFNKEWNKTVIIVTHDPKIASRCKKVVFMKDGVLTKELSRDTCAPKSSYYQSILDNI